MGKDRAKKGGGENKEKGAMQHAFVRPHKDQQTVQEHRIDGAGRSENNQQDAETHHTYEAAKSDERQQDVEEHRINEAWKIEDDQKVGKTVKQ